MKLLKGFAAVAVVAAFALTGHAEEKKVSPLSVKMKSIDGKDLDLSKYKGKVVLIVNVASKCGYTKQYEGLQALYADNEAKGFVILGVPANDFGKQEPGTEEEIQKFCSSKYKVTFPMTSKVVVKGGEKTELYKILTEATPNKGKVEEVGWNFEKFLIGRDGTVVGRYKSAVAPDNEDLLKAIKTELDKK
jgi:glutathione peroxidase